MDDLLSELDSINGDVAGSSRGKKDGSSSPLRPNAKYCAMVQPAAKKHASPWKPPNRWKGSGVNATQVVFGLSTLPWEKRPSRTRDTSSETPSSALPETVQKIMAATMAGGMEVDEDPISDKSSSPLKPNEKYCSIVTPAKPRVARVAPTVHSSRPAQPAWNQGMPPYAGHYRNPDAPRGSPPHNSSGYGGRAPYYGTPRGPRRHSYREEKPLAEWDREEKQRQEEQERKRELQRRLFEEAAKMEQIRLAEMWQRGELERKRWREAEEERKRSRQRRMEEEAARVARVKKEADDKRRYEEENRKAAEERRRADRRARAREDEERRERQARDRLKSHADVKPKGEEGTVRMTKEELEELKARCQAEGARLAEARRSEAAARMNQGLQKVDQAKEEEPEPMEVEESDVVESSVPASCSGTRIAPIPLLVKEEPLEEAVASPPDTPPFVRLEEIPLPLGPAPKARGNEEVNKKGDEEEIQIIDKPPAEVVTLSDDEGTVAGSTVGDGHQSIKQEPPSTKEQEEDLWVIGSQRGRKKAHVFDLSKVKEEEKEEGSGAKVSDSSATTQTLPFNAARVKAEPAEKERKEGEKKEEEGRKKKEEQPKGNEKEQKTTEESKVSESTAQGVPFKAVRVKAEPGEKEKEESAGRKEEEKDMAPSSSAIKSESTERSTGNTVSPPATVSPPRLDYGPALPPLQAHAEPSQSLQQVQQAGGDGELLQGSAAMPQEADVAAALAAARRLLREIGQQAQQVLPQLPQPQLRPARQPRPTRQAHEPPPGSFMHSLRSASRKRKRWCDFDEDEEDWLRYEDSTERHEWGAKRGRIEEDEEE